MAQLMQAFDARNVDPTQGVGGLPIGRHPVQIIKSEVKPTKDGSSGYAQFDLSVLDGPSKGAVGAYRLNLYHDNPQTVEIAHKQLSALCHVTGVYQIQDTAQLHGVPFVVVGLQKEPNLNKYTEVKRVFDINGNEPGQGGGGQQQQNNGGNAGGWGNQQQNNQQNNQQQGNQQGCGNNAGWGGQSQVANNVPMPDNNGGNQNQNQGQQGNGNGGGWNNQNQQQGNQNQQGNQQGNGGGNGWQGNQNQGNGQQGQNQGNGGGWAQNSNNGQGGGNPSWGQPR